MYVYSTKYIISGALNKVERYVGHRNFLMSEIDKEWLIGYEKYLKFTLKNKRNTVYNNMHYIRKIIKGAIEDELFPVEKNPFLKFRFKNEKTERAYITEEELLKLKQSNKHGILELSTKR